MRKIFILGLLLFTAQTKAPSAEKTAEQMCDLLEDIGENLNLNLDSKRCIDEALQNTYNNVEVFTDHLSQINNTTASFKRNYVEKKQKWKQQKEECEKELNDTKRENEELKKNVDVLKEDFDNLKKEGEQKDDEISKLKLALSDLN